MPRPTRKRPKAPKLATEHVEQSLLFQWAESAQGQHPELALLHAIPNAGGYSGGFKANVARVQKMRREGVKPGVPDIHLPVRREPYSSLYVELKVKPNTTTEAQDAWLSLLAEHGNATAVCWSWEEARDVILLYLYSPDVFGVLRPAIAAGGSPRRKEA